MSLVTVRVTRNVKRMARNIHIIGWREKSARPSGILTRDGIFSGGRSTDTASRCAVLAPVTCTLPSCAPANSRRDSTTYGPASSIGQDFQPFNWVNVRYLY